MTTGQLVILLWAALCATAGVVAHHAAQARRRRTDRQLARWLANSRHRGDVA